MKSWKIELASAAWVLVPVRSNYASHRVVCFRARQPPRRVSIRVYSRNALPPFLKLFQSPS
jgi:hypothetical protein